MSAKIEAIKYLQRSFPVNCGAVPTSNRIVQIHVNADVMDVA